MSRSNAGVQPVSADRIEEHNSKRRIANHDEPVIVQMWRLASNEPKYLPRDQKADAPVDPRAQVDAKGVTFLQAMQTTLTELKLPGGNMVPAQADRLGIHGQRIGQFADLVGHDPKKGAALLQAASLATTIPQERQSAYPGMVPSVGKPELEDYFKARDAAEAAKAAKQPVAAVRPIAVDGVIQTMAQRYTGFSALAR